jgi:hypothetical protein
MGSSRLHLLQSLILSVCLHHHHLFTCQKSSKIQDIDNGDIDIVISCCGLYFDVTRYQAGPSFSGFVAAVLKLSWMHTEVFIVGVPQSSSVGVVNTYKGNSRTHFFFRN